MVSGLKGPGSKESFSVSWLPSLSCFIQPRVSWLCFHLSPPILVALYLPESEIPLSQMHSLLWLWKVFVFQRF